MGNHGEKKKDLLPTKEGVGIPTLDFARLGGSRKSMRKGEGWSSSIVKERRLIKASIELTTEGLLFYVACLLFISIHY